MTEEEYIVTTNLARARAAKQLISEIMPGYGIHTESWRAVNAALQEWCEQLTNLVELG